MRPQQVPQIVVEESASALASLDFLTLFAERISHALRTPLGMIDGVVGDLVLERKVAPEDLLFANRAVQDVLEVLDLLKLLCTPVSFTPKKTNLTHFLLSEFHNLLLRIIFRKQ